MIPSKWDENSALARCCSRASSVPVVVADVEGLAKLVGSGVVGVAAAPGRHQGLVERLSKRRTESICDGLLDLSRRRGLRLPGMG